MCISADSGSGPLPHTLSVITGESCAGSEQLASFLSPATGASNGACSILGSALGLSGQDLRHTYFVFAFYSLPLLSFPSVPLSSAYSLIIFIMKNFKHNINVYLCY